MNNIIEEKAIKYDELTEKLGCPVEVLFKALKYGIYDSNGNFHQVEHFVYYHPKQLHCRMLLNEIRFALNMYKIDWFLKEDKSE